MLRRIEVVFEWVGFSYIFMFEKPKGNLVYISEGLEYAEKHF
jgi:hypothetical protein